MEKRNGTISFLKFIFSIVVIIFHCNLIFYTKTSFVFAKSGYLAVEFFFFVSGFYFMKSVERDYDLNNNVFVQNAKYTIKRVRRFVPYTLLACFVTGVLGYFMKQINFANFLLSVYNGLLIGMTGLGYNLNIPIWYLSSSLIIMFILYPIIRIYKEKYTHYIAPLIILFGLGYMYQQYPSLDLSRMYWNNLFFAGLLRCLVELNIGIVIYVIVKYLNNYMSTLKDISLKKRIKILLQVVEIISYTCMFLYITFSYGKTKNDYIALLFIMIATTITLTGKSYINKLFSNKLFYYLEELSFYLFINQSIFLINLKPMFAQYKFGYYRLTLILLLSTLLFSIVELEILTYIRKKKQKKILKV